MLTPLYGARGLLVAAVGAALALMVGFAWLSLEQSRENQIRKAATDSENLVRLLEISVRDAMSEADMTLLAAADEFKRQGSPVREKEFNEYLGRLEDRVPRFQGLRLSDAKGLVRYGRGVPAEAEVNVADRDYFQKCRDEQYSGLVISAPILGRFSHEWVLILARRLTASSGDFTGVVYITIPLRRFQEVFATLKVGRAGAVNIFDSGLRVIARYPDLDGQLSATGVQMHSLEINALWREGRESATYTTANSMDGVARTYSYRKVGAYPLNVMVGLAPDDYLEKWRDEAVMAWVFVAGFVAVVVVSSALLWVAWGAKTQVVRVLSERDARLNALVEELQASEAHFRRLFEDSAEAMLLFDGKVFTHCNAQALAMFGLSDKQELLGRTPRELSPPFQGDGRSSRDKASEMNRLAFAKGSHSFEWDFKRKNEEVFTGEVLLSVVQSRGQRMLHVILRDVTARKVRDQAQARLAAIVESSDAAIIGRDLDGTITTWNPGAERLLGFKAKDVVGRRVNMFYPEQCLDEELELGERVARGETVKHYETTRVRADGSEVQVEIFLSPIRDALGGIVGISSLARDITERKKAEAELYAANQAAQAANRAKSEFLANMSHEIRTPMNAIIGFAQLALHTDLTPRQRDYVEKIRTSSTALLGILGDILDYSKIEAGRMDLESIGFDLLQTLRSSVQLFSPGMEEKGLAFSLDLAPDTPLALMGDPLRLGQVINNLLGNAVKFTKQGEIRLRVEPVEKGESQAVLRFSVQDTGIGISQDQIGLLFHPFAQADGSITRRYGGTGLGLAICRQLAELMGGSIAVQSAPGQGSTFTLTARFALAGAQAPAQAPAKAERSAFDMARPLAGARVLLVEDNDLNQEVARMFLERAGLTVTVAGNGAEGVRLAREEDFEAVLMDLQMPGMDGFAATRLIRGLPGRESLPIIAMTAAILDRDKEACLEAGMNDHLAKPIEFPELVEILMRWIKPREPWPRPPVKPEPWPQPALFPEIGGIDSGRASQLMSGNLALYSSLLSRLAANFAQTPGLAMADFKAGQTEQAARRLHTLRGAAGNVGALEVAGLAGEAEEAIREDRPVAGHLVELQTAMAGLVRSIRGYLASAGPSGPVGPGGRDETAFSGLLEALLARKATALELFEKSRAMIEELLGQDKTALLASAIEDLRFQEAADMLKGVGESS